MALEFIDGVAIGFWIVVIILSLAISGVLFYLYAKSEHRVKYRLAFCLVFLSLGISRIILMYFDYFLTELNPVLYENYQLMWKLAQLFELIGLGFLILISEDAVFKGKDYYVFSIGFSIVVCIGMLIQEFLLTQNILVYALAFAILIPISWLYLAIKLPDTRKNTLLIFLGIIICGAGLILISAAVVEALLPLMNIHYIYLLSAIIQIPGLLIIATGVKRMYFAT